MSTFLMKPKVDFAFKEIMRNDNARIGFLSAILKINPKDIKETIILNTDLSKVHEDDKQGILDVQILLNNSFKPLFNFCFCDPNNNRSSMRAK